MNHLSPELSELVDPSTFLWLSLKSSIGISNLSLRVTLQGLPTEIWPSQEQYGHTGLLYTTHLVFGSMSMR